MTLQGAMLSAGSPVLNEVMRDIPSNLLNKGPEQFTTESRDALRKIFEEYARKVSFSARIKEVREINDFCDGFFNFENWKACRLERVFDNTEMDILLLKELQGGSDELRYSMTQEQRAEQFGMSTNAMQTRIHALEQGKEILGHRVKIEIDGRGRTAYDNTIHPIFCALNLKEAYFLTVELRKAFKGTLFEQLANDISADIYKQLSGYAQDRLRQQIKDAGLGFEQSSMDELIDLRKEIRDAIYFLKSGENCVLQLMNGETYTGWIRSGASGLELEDSEGNRIALPEDPGNYILNAMESNST